MNYYFAPGDIVREESTAQERTVIGVSPDGEYIEFDDSALNGWTPAQGWAQTGRRAE